MNRTARVLLDTGRICGAAVLVLFATWGAANWAEQAPVPLPPFLTGVTWALLAGVGITHALALVLFAVQATTTRVRQFRARPTTTH
jgi:hypothetical protein